MSDKILTKILGVITENFTNGVRADFITETQIRRAYKLRYGDEEIPAAFSVTAFIKKTAFFYGGKYYFVSTLNKGRVFRLVDATLNAGNVIVYYEELFRRHRGKFCDWHIKTPAVLGALIGLIIIYIPISIYTQLGMLLLVRWHQIHLSPSNRFTKNCRTYRSKKLNVR